MILVADVGGTKVRAALADKKEDKYVFAVDRQYESKDFPDLETLIESFLSKNKAKINAISLGVAGPVIDDRAKITNLPWIIDKHLLQTRFNCPSIFIINDLVAQGFGLELADQKKMVQLQTGKNSPGNRAMIAAGTGLGETVLFWNGNGHIPSPTEGGHVDFSPRTEEEIELLQYLLRVQKLKSVSWESVTSGLSGFFYIYSFLRDTVGEKPLAQVEEALDQGEQRIGPLINKAAENDESIAIRTMRIFSALYGAEAGNLALKSLALNGVFLAGGIAPKIVGWLKKPWFIEAFWAKDRQESLLKDIPVSIVMDELLALKGLCAEGDRHLKKYQ